LQYNTEVHSITFPLNYNSAVKAQLEVMQAIPAPSDLLNRFLFVASESLPLRLQMSSTVKRDVTPRCPVAIILEKLTVFNFGVEE
jgi:hypothetical protein